MTLPCTEKGVSIRRVKNHSSFKRSGARAWAFQKPAWAGALGEAGSRPGAAGAGTLLPVVVLVIVLLLLLLLLLLLVEEVVGPVGKQNSQQQAFV